MVDVNGTTILTSTVGGSSQSKCIKNTNDFNNSLTRARKPLGMPQLDEKQLEVGAPESTALNAPFVMPDGLAAPAPPATMENAAPPIGLGGPVLLVGPGSPYNAGNLFTIDNSQGNAAFVTLCQQPSFHYQQPAPQPTVVDQEVALTHKCLQECPRAVLVAALTSLLEEFPLLCPIIRQRCEKATMVLPKQQQHQQQQQQQQQQQHQLQHQQQGITGRFAGLTQSAVPWAAHPPTASYDTQRTTLISTGGNSPQTGGSRKGRGNKSREEGICSLHNNVRSMNHLQLNKQKGVYECVSGFHCLEDGCSGSASPASTKVARTPLAPVGVSQVRGGDGRGVASFAAMSGGNLMASSKLSAPVGSIQAPKDQFSDFMANSLDSGLTPFRGDVSLGNSGIVPCDDPQTAEGSETIDLDSSVVTLKSILHSVRMVAEMEE
ncbi:uncharacterized protein TEOVI_000364500 [Trypanosoma equiperdum]|uniref:Uncharacterized protein n=1 Tax=Trypanosoma equiperdum TaxID=5694 RepID=A0A1G4IIG6_TRYEQ|nr:hypothetical protein, conserved [Trypanosoma equiperdum]